MATLQVETIVTVTADRGVRSALRNCLRSEAYRLEHCDSVISGSDAEAAHEALAHATHLVEMFDQLGWADNDPRERYEITVALDSFVPWLRGHRRDLAESIARETTEMTGITHDEVLDWRRELEAIDAFLERLDSMGQSTSRRSDSRPAVALRAGRRYASATPSTWST